MTAITEDLPTLKRRYAASLGLPNPEHATLSQILDAISRLPEDSMVHPDDMRDHLFRSLPEADPDRALFR